MSEPVEKTAASDARDAADLGKFGYAQELLRDMGGYSNFAVSFSIISILTGAVTLYGWGLRYGGPFEMTVGWPIVTLLTLPVALALAELASAYPTSGALYHWASILGGRAAGWWTAWLNAIGQVTVTTGIDYGLALLVQSLLGLPEGTATTIEVFGAILFSHALLNHVGIRVVARLNDLSALYHVLGVLLFVGVVAFSLPSVDAGVLLVRRTTSDYPYWYAFLVGLLQAQWTFTGYDASAHVTEETHDPRRNAPWGIVLSVALSGVAGYLLLLGVTLLVKDVAAAQGAGEDPAIFIHVLTHGVGERLGRALTWIAVIAMWFCGLSSVTSNSRMVFAFARDGGMPLSASFARVSKRFQTPALAIWACALASFLTAVWSGGYYGAITSMSTVALYASYVVPIVCAALGPSFERGPWHLGRWSGAVRWAAIAWTAFILVLFVLPPNVETGKASAGLLALLAVAWFGRARRTFVGPKLG